MLAGNYASAYGLFSEPFRFRVQQPTFEARWKMLQDPRSYAGKIKSIKGNGIVQFADQGERHIALTKLVLTTDRPGGKEEFTERFMVEFEQTPNGVWQIGGLELFPPPQPQPKR